MPCVGIVGTGLIGASIGLAARGRGWEALGCDRDPAAESVALRNGAIDRVAERDEIYGTADVVVIAAHVSGTLEEIMSLRRRALRDDQLIIDVASVKAPIARAADGIVTFVPTHPMAGGERRGPDAARSDLFEGRICRRRMNYAARKRVSLSRRSAPRHSRWKQRSTTQSLPSPRICRSLSPMRSRSA